MAAITPTCHASGRSLSSIPHGACRSITEPDQAIAMRRRLLDRLAAHKMPIVGYHFPFPGLGIVERKDAAYRFVTA